MAGSGRRAFRAADLLKQVMIQELDVAPDGSFVVYSRRTIEDGKYRRRLWRVGFEGGREQQLTTADASDGRPRVSPDGRALLFLSDRSGRAQPWVMPLEGGEPRQLAEFEGDVRSADWSPDGRRVLVLAPSGVDRFIVGDKEDPVARHIKDLTWRLDGLGVREQFHAPWIVPAPGGKPKRVLEPSSDVAHVFWASDGRRIGFVADLRDEAGVRELPQAWSVPIKGGRPQELCRLRGAILTASWGPAGEVVVWGSDEPDHPEWANLYVHVVEDGRARPLAADEDRSFVNASYGDLVDPDSFSSAPFQWLDRDHLVALAGVRGATLPFRLGLDGAVQQLADDDFVCSAIASGAGRVAVVATDRGHAGEVYSVEDGGFRRLTGHGSRWLAPWQKHPERITVSHPEGHDIDAWILRGRGGRKPRPLVVQIHGGPHASHSPTPWLEMLALADAGIHVLYPNPRGSVGYGEAFARSLEGVWGEPDGSDILTLVDWAIDQGMAERDRIGVLGLSYGGFMVNWLLGHFPGRFAAGVSENPVTDLVSEFGGADFGADIGRLAAGTDDLPEDLKKFYERSPFAEIHNNRAPLLLLQAEGDLRCPALQSELVFTILRSRGVTVEMVRYPDEPHYLTGVGRPDRRVDRIERIVDWFGRYLASARRPH